MGGEHQFEALDGLDAAVDAVASLDAGGLAGALEVVVRRLLAVQDRLAAVVVAHSAAYAAEGGWAATGAGSAPVALAEATRSPVADRRADLRLGRALAGMPVVADALGAGRITRTHAERLAWAWGGGREAAFAAAEAQLVGWARALRPVVFDQAVRQWTDAADDARAEGDAAARDRERWCSVTRTFDGGYRLDAQLPAVAGAEVAEALRRIEQELFHADWSRARTDLGRRPAVSELARTGDQRRADALVVMAQRACTAPADGKRPEPLVTVSVDRPTLFERVCELADGTPLTPGEVRPLLTRARVERAVFGPGNQVTLGRRARAFWGAERRAVEVRDRSCTFPGCDVPAERCDVDHVRRYEDGGDTTQANGRLRCPTHHPGRRRHQPWLTGRPPDDTEPEPPDGTDELVTLARARVDALRRAA